MDPASYHSFIDLTTPHHDAIRRSQSSRGPSHRRVRKAFQAVDRPSSFLDLDLGESDVQTSCHPPYSSDLTFENARDTRVVNINLPLTTTGNCERDRKRGRDTNDVRPSSCDPTSIGRITRQGTPHSVRSAAQTCDLSSGKMPPYSLRAPEFLENDRPPRYEEVTAPAPVSLGEMTIQQVASKYPGSSYYVDYTKFPSPPPSQDPQLCARNPAVVLPAQRARCATRPLPPIPSSNRTHAHLTTPLDTEMQSLHVDDLNTTPPKVGLQDGESAPPKDTVWGEYRLL